MNQISSKNQRVLVFSDPHQEIDKVKRILAKESYDKVVCLGDWFDSFFYNDTLYTWQTAEFLKNLIFQENFTTLWGNHDLHYLYDNKYAICSGYSREKDKVIVKTLGDSFAAVRDKFKWFIWIDDFLCTHAGVHVYHFPAMLSADKAGITEWLTKAGKLAELSLINGGTHWFYRAGEARGGSQRIGGIVWADFNDEFEPIAGLKQLVGHTYHPYITNCVSDSDIDLSKAENLDIDCNLNQYLIIHNGKAEIKNLYDL